MILLQEAAGGGMNSMFFMVAIIGVMYFFFLRPQMKRQREENKYRKELSKGMRVVTTSGIHGKILEMDEETVLLECENSRLRFLRSAISKELSAKIAKS